MLRRPAPTPSLDQKPEILAPAGGRAQLEAAVWAGADAVYFGLDAGFNARVRATAFSIEELEPTMAYLHERGVRGYLTLNTLVFDEELEQAERLIRHAALAGVDALIVQDIGLVILARKLAPGLPVHGSTQMTITDAAGVDFAEQLGVKRVVIGRELSVDEIARVVSDTTLEIEAFVHGALCVSYSGQCFSSEAWGGRSANRGQCAQACRLPYGLLVDGELRAQGDYRYLLSPQDLMALEQLPRLIRAGVSCLKIEGRLKGPEYVRETVTAYRDGRDRIWRDLKSDSVANDAYRLPTDQRRRLAQAFSRGQDANADGLTPGFLEGPQHQSLVIGRNPRHRGVFVGEVTHVTKDGVQTDLSGPVKRGDGLVFDRGRPEDREYGGNVHHVIDRDRVSLTEETDQGHVELRFGPDFACTAINPGDRIWRTRDSARDRAKHLAPKLAANPVPVDVEVQGGIGQALSIQLEDRDNHQVCVVSKAALQAAAGRPLDAAKVQKAIGTFGDTPFVIERFSCHLDDAGVPLFIPISEIKSARRMAIEALLAQRRKHKRGKGLAPAPVLTDLLPASTAPSPAPSPALSLLCRTKEQVAAALAFGNIDEIVLDFLEVHGLKDAALQVKEAGHRLTVAAPRVFKPGEERLWRYYCRLSPDALLVRSSGLIHELQKHGGSGALLNDGETRIPVLHGDFSLNAANLISAAHLLGDGLGRLTLAHDLNAAQICALTRSLPPAQRQRIEIVAHHHLPIFHTEYCVFARFLSTGNSYRDCGRPCERHTVHLRDPGGGDHLVQADIGCRNTVFNAAAQSAGPLLNDFRAAGIGHYRIELVDEPAHQVAEIVQTYLGLLAGKRSPKKAHESLSRVTDANGNPAAVGLGSLAVRLEPPRSRMKKPTAR